MSFGDEILQHKQHLYRMAMNLMKDSTRAEDLVQDVIVRALSSATQFQDDGNPESLKRWLSTILRNQFYSFHRKKRESEDVDGIGESHLISAEDQFSSLSSNQSIQFLDEFDPETKSMLLMLADGLSYEEIAEKLVLAVGTVKSRVSRARDKLQELDTAEAVYRPKVEPVDNENYRAVVPLSSPSSNLPPVLPTIEWVDPKTLLIEVTYQRDLTKKSIRFIKRIIKEWDWQKFTVPNCSRLANGRLAILNGQHTSIAAASHPQITKIPVYVSPSGTTLSGRAESFVSLNRDKLAMSALSLFHANIAAGDMDSILLQKAVKEAGCYFPKEKPAKARKTNQLFNPKVWLVILQRNNMELITRIARIVLAAKRGSLPRDVLNGIAYVVKTPRFKHVTDDNMSEYIRTQSNLYLNIRNFSEEYSVSPDVAFAELVSRWLAAKK